MERTIGRPLRRLMKCRTVPGERTRLAPCLPAPLPLLVVSPMPQAAQASKPLRSRKRPINGRSHLRADAFAFVFREHQRPGLRGPQVAGLGPWYRVTGNVLRPALHTGLLLDHHAVCRKENEWQGRARCTGQSDNFAMNASNPRVLFSELQPHSEIIDPRIIVGVRSHVYRLAIIHFGRDV